MKREVDWTTWSRDIVGWYPILSC